MLYRCLARRRNRQPSEAAHAVTGRSGLLHRSLDPERTVRVFRGVSSDKRIAMAKSMTLRAVQKFAPDKFTSEALDAADTELAQIPREGAEI